MEYELDSVFASCDAIIKIKLLTSHRNKSNELWLWRWKIFRI